MTSDFIDAVFRMGLDILREYGHDGYQKSWGEAFPRETFAALQSAVLSQPSAVEP